MEVFYLYPTETSWRAHDRRYWCIAIADADRMGTMRGILAGPPTS